MLYLLIYQDPPRGSEYWIPTDPRFVHARDLVSYIRTSPEYSSHFCIGVAGKNSHDHIHIVNGLVGYPDRHPDQEVNEEEELIHLKEKVDAGADYIVTQLFYDVDAFLSWLQRVRAKGISVRTFAQEPQVMHYRHPCPDNCGNTSHTKLCIFSSSYESVWHANSSRCDIRLGAP